MNYKETLLYFTKVNLNKKNLDKLKKNFNLISLNNTNQIKKKKITKRVLGIYCHQSFTFDKNILSYFEKLDYLISSTTATTFIDKEYCKKRKIKIISLENDKKYLKDITPTAEHVFGLILNISRKYQKAIDSVHKGYFDRSNFGGYRMLSKCTLGIIGFGRLGKIVRRIAKGFKMKVFSVDKTDQSYNLKLKKILKNSDFISLNIPHKNNHNFFSYNNIKITRPFYLINTSRGEVVNEKFIIKMLKKKKILGYGTDVLQEEFKKKFELRKNIIWKNRNKLNILITPHIGGSTEDAWFSTQKRVIDKFLKECKKKKII